MLICVISQPQQIKPIDMRAKNNQIFDFSMYILEQTILYNDFKDIISTQLQLQLAFCIYKLHTASLAIILYYRI